MKQTIQPVLIILFLFIAIISKAQINASATEGCAPLASVLFTHSYSNPTGILWDFDDGATSNLSNPTHSFASAGVYTVTFTATVGGNTVNSSIVITVYANPTADFVLVPEGVCIGESMEFQDASTGGSGSSIINWQWDFGDGSPISNSPSPTHAYSNTGLYSVTLIVTDGNNCIGTLNVPAAAAISEAPNVNILTSPSPASSCEPPLEVSFTNNSTSNSPTGNDLDFTWDFGNGETSNAENPPSVTYSALGSYTITITATDEQGCTDTQIIPVSVQEPDASFSVIGAENDTVCNTIQIVNEGTPGGIYNYGDGSAGSSMSHTYAVEGYYTITRTINSQGCSDQETLEIFVEIPTATIVSSPGFACYKPAEFTYSLESDYNLSSFIWDLSDGTVSTQEPATGFVDYEGPNEYAINGLKIEFTNVQFTTVNGCTGNAFIRDSIALPNALFYPDITQGCAPLSVVFDDESSYYHEGELVDWEWHFGDGDVENQSSSSNTSHVYTEAGEYEAYLIVTNAAGCIDTSYIHTIEVGVPLTPDFTFEPAAVCPGDSVTITNTSGNQDLIDSYAYIGDNGTLFNCIAEDQPVFVFDEVAGNYPIEQISEYNGCLTSTTQMINVQGPVGKLTYACNCDTPLDYSFEGEITGSDHWTWDFGDETIIENSTEAFMSHSYETSGNYWAVLTSFSDASGCDPFIDSVLVKVRQVEAVLNVPELACAGTSVFISASNSVDVAGSNDGCYMNYLWYFDDGTRPVKTYGPASPHVFNSNGEHTISLFVKDDNECVDSTSAVISIFDISAEYEADILYGCPPFEVNFSDLSIADTTIVSWQWNFGDGNSSFEQNPANIFDDPVFGPDNTPLPHSVSLIVTDTLGCTDVINDIIIQPLGPNPHFIATSTTNICVGEDVSFAPSGSNPLYNTYNWEYGNGDTSEGTNGNSIFDEAGEYTITLTVTDTTGCSREESIELVSVQAYPIAIIEPSFDEDEVLCYPSVLSFTDASVIDPFGSRTWDLGLGGPTLNIPEVGASYLLPGAYTVDLAVQTTFGCADNTSIEVNIEGPLAEIDLQPDAICVGGSIELNLVDTADLAFWQFDFGDGTVASNEWPTPHTYDNSFIPASGQTLITLVMYSADSACSSARTTNLFIEEVIAGFDRNNEFAELDSIHCFGTADTFFNTSTPNTTIFDWSFSGGQNFSSQNPPPVTLSPGFHSIQLIVETNLGCRDTIVKNMEIYPLPDPTISENSEICQGDEIELFATGGINYSWNPSESVDDPSSANVIATPEFSTNYSVLVTDSNDCSRSANTFVLVHQPGPSITRDTILRIGDSDFTGFDLGSGYTYQWSPDIYLECSTCPETVFTPLENMLYTLTISDSLGCFAVDSYFGFTILEVASVDIPDAFTPNGDGVNDVVYVKGWGIENLVSFKIYNRWGELIFEAAHIHDGWDGRYKGEIQNPDSYAYVVVVKNYIKGEPETFKGFIDLLR